MNKKIVDLSAKDIRQAVWSFLCFLFGFPDYLLFCLTCFLHNILSSIFPLCPFCSCTLSSLLIVVNHLFNAFQIPRALPYFAVDFGLQGGFAHVIENEQKFPHYFGKVSLCIKAVILGTSIHVPLFFACRNQSFGFRNFIIILSTFYISLKLRLHRFKISESIQCRHNTLQERLKKHMFIHM